MARELIVVTKAKDLSRIVIDVTNRAPKRFRFTFSSRMQNLSLDVIEDIYTANETFTGGAEGQTARNRRLALQHCALTKVKLLSYVSLLAREQNAILPKQYERIVRLTTDVQNLLGAWIKSDSRRAQDGRPARTASDNEMS